MKGAIRNLIENGKTDKATIPTSVYLLVVSLAIIIGTAKLKNDIITPYQILFHLDISLLQ